jgi:hypothetical protein
MVLSGDIPSDCNLASFRQARFFDFFNEIGQILSNVAWPGRGGKAPRAVILGSAIKPPGSQS